MAGAPIAADGSKGLGPLLAGWDGDLADAAPESQAQRAAPVTAGVDVLKILSACGQYVSIPALLLHASASAMLRLIMLSPALHDRCHSLDTWHSSMVVLLPSEPYVASIKCSAAVSSSLGTGLDCWRPSGILKQGLSASALLYKCTQRKHASSAAFVCLASHKSDHGAM